VLPSNEPPNRLSSQVTRNNIMNAELGRHGKPLA
jgi:hypothetical protein